MANRNAVITGGSGGLGMEIAYAFSEHGYNIVINYLQSDRTALKVIKAISKTTGNKAVAVRADVSSFYDVSEMVEFVKKKFGRVDVFVNNAGITKDALLIKQTEEEWDRIMDVNLKGAFNCIKAFALLMKNGGHIINISSYSGLKGKEGQVAYSASKAALFGLTKTAAIELAKYNIRVNAVLPGYMPTKMGIAAKTALQKAKNDSILNTLSDPKEVARFIVYLAGTENITGQIFCLESRII
ncbi:beta-ketoacyl-ACP reductase [Dissulfurispira thermophila]|uniref:Beta-ketoacyl-ACP reductase n=2 Tax=root TaxID=1 RepID=A0A7G1H0Y9_9BACT|nr:SDR family oxidoreductase [Dissulfurispira thermophila]BCB95803.1 beta-ketoacyl-ACP reductase [Dissulfurispira thermophila]